MNRAVLRLPLIAAFCLSAGACWALQTLDVRDGVAVEAVVSTREPTRIRIEGGRIQDVFGNIYTSTCASKSPDGAGLGVAHQQAPVNPAGEFVLSCDTSKGEIYVTPVGTSAKPINVFLSTERATYTLLLRRSDVPSETIVLRDRSLPARDSRRQDAGGRSPDYIRGLKNMLIALARDEPGDGVAVRAVDRPVALWAEARFVLTRTLDGFGLVGEHYTLTNIGDAAMVLAEQEFDRADVLAVAVDVHRLEKGQSTAVYVVRSGEQP